MRARGSVRGRGGFSARGRGGSRPSFNLPPSRIIEFGKVLHACEGEIVCTTCSKESVPYFNGRIYFENQQEIGKVDEILGPINEYMFSVKVAENIKASSISPETKLFVDPQQTLPLQRFLPKPVDPLAFLKRKKKKNKGGLENSNGGSRRGRDAGQRSRGRGGFRRGNSRPFRSRGSRN